MTAQKIEVQGETVTKLVAWLRKKNRQRLEKRQASRRRKAPSLCAHVDFEEQIDPASLTFVLPEHPDVSIIIPGYGKADVTLRCLKSLLTSNIACSYEVIVVEDASADPSAELLRQVSGVRLIWNPQNLGFLRTCNHAAQQAHGEYIYLLNNDTILLSGSLDTLLETARSRPDAGIVGSKLIYPDGRLQEAGGVVWSNGDAANYGRGWDPTDPRFSYAREVDYISGASILIHRERWNEMGGFDERYVPAYYEDTDLAIRFTKAGRPNLLEPKSVVVHCEGVSNGTSTDSGIKAYQVVNREKFLAAHSDFLRRTKGHSGDLSYRAIDGLKHRKGLVLIIDHYLPEPDVDAGSRNMMEFVRTLLSLNYVVKFWPQNLQGNPKYVQMLEELGVETFRGPYQVSFKDWVANNGKDITHVLLSRPTVAPYYFDDIRRCTNAKVIYYGHDLHFARLEMEAKVKQSAEIEVCAEKMKRTEFDIWSKSDLVLYPSQEEVDSVRKIAPDVAAQFVPPFQFDRFVEKSEPNAGREILFVAGFQHAPNVDAALWLVHEVMPNVWKDCPDAVLYLVGSKPTDDVRALAQDGRVVVTGGVSAEVLEQHYTTARVSVVPLRFGAGVKLKVLETMQFGVPLVTTTVGLQGLPGVADALIATDRPEQIAAELIHFLSSDAAWLARSAAQTTYVRRQFSTDRMRQRLDELLAVVNEVN
jgi:GT2 family glycosyltransferase